mmetsp:Transcript_5848/g.19923  ORF Transcript_5848/g.19923 Transcript_5848/m.19923 type:complete len:329 (-) Transcript_5848:209-1195(-)
MASRAPLLYPPMSTSVVLRLSHARASLVRRTTSLELPLPPCYGRPDTAALLRPPYFLRNAAAASCFAARLTFGEGGSVAGAAARSTTAGAGSTTAGAGAARSTTGGAGAASSESAFPVNQIMSLSLRAEDDSTGAAFFVGASSFAFTSFTFTSFTTLLLGAEALAVVAGMGVGAGAGLAAGFEAGLGAAAGAASFFFVAAGGKAGDLVLDAGAEAAVVGGGTGVRLRLGRPSALYPTYTAHATHPTTSSLEPIPPLSPEASQRVTDTTPRPVQAEGDTVARLHSGARGRRARVALEAALVREYPTEGAPRAGVRAEVAAIMAAPTRAY